MEPNKPKPGSSNTNPGDRNQQGTRGGQQGGQQQGSDQGRSGQYGQQQPQNQDRSGQPQGNRNPESPNRDEQNRKP